MCKVSSTLEHQRSLPEAESRHQGLLGCFSGSVALGEATQNLSCTALGFSQPCLSVRQAPVCDDEETLLQ